MAKEKQESLPGSYRGRVRNAEWLRKVDPKEEIVVTIGLSGPKLPNPDKFVGQTMTLRQIVKKYGAKKADVEKVKNSLMKAGLKVGKPSLGRRIMPVRGPAKAMEDAFDPAWAVYRSPSQVEFRSRHGRLKVPKELKGIVTGVFGLDQRPMARSNSGAKVPDGHETALRPFTPAKIENHYNFPPGDGEGQTIAIAEFGGDYFKEDMIAYCKKFRRPVPKNIRTVSVGKARIFPFRKFLNIPDPEMRKHELENSFEVMMDVEIIAGLCPKANILVYFAKDDQRGWIDLLNKVIHLNRAPVALSISWGRNENDKYWSKNAKRAINDLLNVARLLGITVCVASGDYGSIGSRYVPQSQLARVLFPASSPHVLAVGGTMLKLPGKEVTWRQDPVDGEFLGGATGGGVSQYFPRPAWQNVKVDSVNPSLYDGRVVPDVAALAGSPYYNLIIAGVPWSDGQTSAAAPVWAALVARINASLPLDKQQRFLTPLLYKKLGNGQTLGQTALRDIKTGSNKILDMPGYKARKGFDAVTGWGVPDGKELLKCLRKI
jgi:kumamolisin